MACFFRMLSTAFVWMSLAATAFFLANPFVIPIVAISAAFSTYCIWFEQNTYAREIPDIEWDDSDLEDLSNAENR